MAEKGGEASCGDNKWQKRVVKSGRKRYRPMNLEAQDTTFEGLKTGNSTILLIAIVI